MMLKALSIHPLLPRSSFSRIILSKVNTMSTPKIPKFISVEGADIHSSRSKSDGIRFSIVSYNILAQVYVKSSLFPHSPSSCLKWKARSQTISALLKDINADFFCLQELDEYDEFYKGIMESYGFSSLYMKRSGQKRDGCGIFYKNDSAELILQERIEYNDLVDTIPHEDTMVSAIQDGDNHTAPKSNGVGRGDPNDPRVRLKRDCVAIFSAFKLKKHFDHIIIVGNTHLYWDPEWADVKLAQAKYFSTRLARFRTTVSENFEASPSVIVAGDFNSVPGDTVYKYLVSGSSSSGELRESEEELPLPLLSVYGVTTGEPPFTNCTPGFTGTLDYLLFSPANSITPLSVLQLPDSDHSPDVLGGLPNFNHPSDHLPIGAEFEISRD